MKWSKWLIVLFVSLFLFVLVNISRWIGTVKLDDNQIEAINFALTLTSILAGARHELQMFERRLREERKKEVRQQRLKLLDDIESLVKEISSTFKEIAILDKRLSERQDGEFSISPEEIEALQKELTRLEQDAYIERFRSRDIDDEELTSKIGLMQVRLNESEYMLSIREFPISEVVIPEIARVRQAIDKARQRELERD